MAAISEFEASAVAGTAGTQIHRAQYGESDCLRVSSGVTRKRYARMRVGLMMNAVVRSQGAERTDI